MRRIVVIGGLAAGPAAAVQAVRRDPSSEVTLVEAGNDIAYGVCELPNVVSGESWISEPPTPDDQSRAVASVAPYDRQRFEKRFGVRVLTNARALELDPRSRRVTVRTEQGTRELRFDAAVLATGSRPRRPPEGAAAVLKSLPDAIRLRRLGQSAAGRPAAVLGAGYIGLEVTDALHRLGLAVTLFDRETLPLRQLEEPGRKLFSDRLERDGVEFRGGIEIDTGIVRGAELVVSALGADPEVELARRAGIEIGPSGAVETDERMETSASSVFAAGDCAEVLHLVSGQRAPAMLATVANRTGRVAGANACGQHVRYAGTVGALAFSAFGLEVGLAGLSAASARRCGFDVTLTTIESSARATALPGATPLQVTLIVDRPTGQLLGANVVGERGAALRLNLLATQIQLRARVADIARLELAYAPSFSPLTDPVVLAARVADRDRR